MRARVFAASGDADVIVAGELFLTGYPPEDLVLKRAFLAHVAEEAENWSPIRRKAVRR